MVGLALLVTTEPRGALVGLIDTMGRLVFWGLILTACARLGARAVGSRLTGMAHIAWDGAAGLALLIALLLIVGLLPGGFRVGAVRSVAAVVIALARPRRGRTRSCDSPRRAAPRPAVPAWLCSLP